jgi:hypothetical protein
MSTAFATAGDEVTGTLTVKGKPTPFKFVAAAVQTDPEDAKGSWLVVLVSDVRVDEADRTPARLAALAAEGKLKAVRVLWRDGTDSVFATPYHQALPQSGRRGSEHPSIDLERYDQTRFEGGVKSKMVGQDWFFQAKVKATLSRGGVVEVEAPAAEQEVADDASGGSDKTRAKLKLGKLGYEYNVEMFEHAVSDASAEAVNLFLAAGMSPNTPSPAARQPLAIAVTGCAYQHEAEAVEMVKALLAAGAKADAGTKDGMTPLLSAAQFCSGVEIVNALLAAGANVNTKAPGGATPLMFAKIFSKKEIEAVLRKAGAKD